MATPCVVQNTPDGFLIETRGFAFLATDKFKPFWVSYLSPCCQGVLRSAWPGDPSICKLCGREWPESYFRVFAASRTDDFTEWLAETFDLQAHIDPLEARVAASEVAETIKGLFQGSSDGTT